MNKVFLTAAFALIALFSKAQAVQDTSLIVNGVCGMCENTIEKAAKLEGVSYAEWDKESLILSLKFDPTKVDLDKINNSIVKAGYDTELKTASDSAYYSLDPCCYYRDPNNAHKH